MSNKVKKDAQGLNRWPAWLELTQGISGLILVLFMWVHMFLVSSILLGEQAMYYVARFFEGVYFFGRPYPFLVSLVVAVIFFLVLIHAVLAIRKIPASYREYHVFLKHVRVFSHADTRLWLVQVVTGFVLIFLVAVHLYQMMTHPAEIGPYLSSDRVWSDRMWPLYLLLLFSVELHGGIGLYRLVMKWGWFSDSNAAQIRRNLQRAKWTITVFFLSLGLLTLMAYMKIGMEHSACAGQRYDPVTVQPVQLTKTDQGMASRCR